MARILLVDDDESIRDFLRIVITRAGHEVVAAADGAAGLDRFTELPADLVLTDLYMPEMDGIEFIKKLQEINPAVKIIAMSGGARFNLPDLLAPAEKLGAFKVLQKPFDHVQLRRALDDALG